MPYHYIEKEELGFIEYKSYLNQILEEIKKKNPEGPVLDVGCGDGRFCFELAKMGFKVVGIDISKRALEFAKIFVPEEKFFCEDITNLSKKFLKENKERFGLVLFVETLEHIEPEKYLVALKNINELLKPDGLLIISVPSTNTPIPKKHFKHFSIGEVKELLSKTGFNIEKISGNTCKPYLILKLFDNRFWCLKPMKRKILDSLEKKFQNCELGKAKRYIICATKVKNIKNISAFLSQKAPKHRAI